MKLCTACRRHVRPGEGACPFCDEPLRTTGSAVVGAMVLLGALGAACTSRPVEDSATGASTGSGSTSTSTSTSASTSSSTLPDPTTTASPSTSGTTASNSTTGELTTANDVDSDDPGCSFYGGACFDFLDPFQCDPWMQDCPPGEKCMPYDSDGDSAWDALRCTPVAPNPGQHGDPCLAEGSGVSGIDDCALGHMCWDVDPDTLQGACVAFCTGTPDEPVCAPAGTNCLLSGNGVLNLCIPICNPLAQDCDAGEVCIPDPQDPNSFVCAPDISGDEGQEFDPCEFSNACDPGLVCLSSALATECDPQFIGCCLPFCDVTAPMCIGQGAECLPWFEMGVDPPGLENVGVCAIPG